MSDEEQKECIVVKRGRGRPVGSGRTKSNYRRPGSEGNENGEFWKLPDNSTILDDFKKSGGSLNAFLVDNILTAEDHKVVAIQVLEQISKNHADQETFDSIRVAAEKAEALLARDEIVRLSKFKSNSQITALKLVQEFTKDHQQKGPTDPMDDHLSEIEAGEGGE